MMKRTRSLAAVSALVFLVLGETTGAGMNPKQTTFVTFNTPFALPRVSLPAGTYIFERIDGTIPDVIRVASRDRRHVYLTAFTRRVERPIGIGRRQIQFVETVPGKTPRVVAWYPDDTSTGHEFVYAE
jgi:hypothetical protein